MVLWLSAGDWKSNEQRVCSDSGEGVHQSHQTVSERREREGGRDRIPYIAGNLHW